MEELKRESREMEPQHHRGHVCVECGKELNQPNEWYINECNYCLKNTAE